MNSADRILVQQYARAFLNIFGSRFLAQDFEAYYKAAHFLRTSVSALRLLKSPLIFEKNKKKILHESIHAFLLPEVTKKLVVLVLEHKNTALLPAIFQAIYQVHATQEGIEFFTIESSHELTQLQKKGIEKFLSIKTGKNIQTRVVINPALIAGLRLQSETQLWEYSVRKQLHALRMARKELYGH